MARVKVKDFITIDIPDDMEYSDNLETQLFTAMKIGPIAEQMKEDGLEPTFGAPSGADRSIVLHSTSFRKLDNDEGLDFTNPGLRGEVMHLIGLSGNQEKFITLIDRDDLIVVYEPIYEDDIFLFFGIDVATPKYYCPGQLWLNDVDIYEEDKLIEEAEKWLKTIEPIKN